MFPLNLQQGSWAFSGVAAETWGSSLATQLMIYIGIMNVHGRGIEAFRIKGKMRVFPAGPVADFMLP